MTVSAENLFLNLWCQAMAKEDAVTPGSGHWDNQREQALRYWASVWLDCLELQAHFDHLTAMRDAAIGMVAPSPAPVPEPVEG